MNNDYQNEVLKKVKEEYQREVSRSSKLKTLHNKLQSGKATQEDMLEYAEELGTILSRIYREQFGVFGDEVIWYTTAEAIITPTLKQLNLDVNDYCVLVQNAINSNEGLSVKSVNAPINNDAIEGIVNGVAEQKYEDVGWKLDEPIINHACKIVDTFIEENLEHQVKSGLDAKLIRTTKGNCCKWCRSVAGVFTYADRPDDVFRRHDNCRCVVTFKSSKSKLKTVHQYTYGTKRKYIYNERYKTYEETVQAREDRLKKSREGADERKRLAREKRIATWQRKREESKR